MSCCEQPAGSPPPRHERTPHPPGHRRSPQTGRDDCGRNRGTGRRAHLRRSPRAAGAGQRGPRACTVGAAGRWSAGTHRASARPGDRCRAPSWGRSRASQAEKGRRTHAGNNRTTPWLGCSIGARRTEHGSPVAAQDASPSGVPAAVQATQPVEQQDTNDFPWGLLGLLGLAGLAGLRRRDEPRTVQTTGAGAKTYTQR